MDGAEIVRFTHVSKQYPGVLANDDITLGIRRGEVFALVGENGAGKSTLMNLLYGLQPVTLGKNRDRRSGYRRTAQPGKGDGHGREHGASAF